MTKRHDGHYEGRTFNGILVLRRCPSGRPSHYLARCHCGREWSVRADSLARGKPRSCGCAAVADRLATVGYEGHRKRPEYGSWRAMKDRCHNPNSPAFDRYGGRGIRVCERWRDSFANFFTDMGPRPTPKHSLDRIDNSGNYKPENCRWATDVEQAQNMRKNRFLTHDGRTLCASEWARVIGVKPGTLERRLNAGWSVERALTEPLRVW